MSPRAALKPSELKWYRALSALSCAALPAHLAGAIEAQVAGSDPLPSIGAWLLITPLLSLCIEWARRLWLASLRSPSSARRDLCLKALTLALALPLYLTSLRAGLTLVVNHSQSAALLPHATALLSFGLLALLTPLSSQVSGLVRSLTRTWRLPRLALSALTLGVSSLALSLGPSALALFKDPPTLCLGLLCLAACITLMLRTRAPLPHSSARLILMVSVALCAVGLAQLSSSPAERSKLERARGLTALTLSLTHTLSDRDGDGFGSWLGGGDCDDERADRNPAAFDLPGNGIDEDCDGRDEPRVTRVRDSVTPSISQAGERMAEGTQGPWNLLIITVDALRADHVSWAGYSRDTTPQLSRLTRSGLTFTHAYTPCADTRYSVPPLFSGRPLPDLSLDWRGRYLILDPKGSDELGLFGRLKRSGYKTGALTGELMTDGMWYGLEAKIDHFKGLKEVSLRRRSSATLTREAKAQLRSWSQGEAPWALWLHYIDPHEPYLSHPQHDFGDRAIDRYDAEIAATDAQIGALLDELDRLSLKERTLVVLSADHGEEFGEHGRRYHGKQLYDESVRVPFVISVPSAPAVSVAEPVSTLDMVETVTELLNVPAGKERSARSHAGRLRGEAGPPPQAVITYRVHNTRPQLLSLSIVEGAYKLIYEVSARRAQLFHLLNDPQERAELSEREPARYRALLSRAQAEVRRFQMSLFESLYERQVSRPQAPPQGLKQVAQNLALVEASARLVKLGGRALRAARARLYVSGPVSGALRFKARWRDASGEVTKTLPILPLGGLYPPSAWRRGELITIESLERLRPEEARHAELVLERRGHDPVIIPAAWTQEGR